MAVTRSATNSLRPAAVVARAPPVSRVQGKRKNDDNTPQRKQRRRKTSKTLPEDAEPVNAKDNATNKVSSNENLSAGVTSRSVPSESSEPLPAALSFSFEAAKDHLVSADPRFADLFTKMACRPFEHLEPVDPFRTLATSILGQQISWMAAKAITHKFIRLFDPSLPEKPSASDNSAFFPTAQQVTAKDIATLRTAGLSGRKAEYVKDLAERFADGRLSNKNIQSADDESLYEMLIAVRGIGKWTVDMFAIFSLRRPDILPVGDLGVQRGVIRWVLSLHSEKHPCGISPRKPPRQLTEKGDDESPTEAAETKSALASQELSQATREPSSDVVSFPLTPVPVTPDRKRGKLSSGKNRRDEGVEVALDPNVPMPPPALTPSIDRTLRRPLPPSFHPQPLPNGLGVSELQSRLNGKKKIKGALLAPSEMEQLTGAWKPYRSLAVYYMWALCEGASPQTY